MNNVLKTKRVYIGALGTLEEDVRTAPLFDILEKGTAEVTTQMGCEHCGSVDEKVEVTHTPAALRVMKVFDEVLKVRSENERS